MASHESPSARDVIALGRAVLGIELGSTRIKAVLIDPQGRQLAAGNHTWENRFVDRVWTYTVEDIWSGVQGSFESMCVDAVERHGVRPTALGALGVSAMMHGYLAIDASGELLTPFRTWRNTTTDQSAAELTDCSAAPFRCAGRSPISTKRSWMRSPTLRRWRP